MNIVKTVALLGILSGLLVAVSYWLIGGPTGATVGLVLAAVMNLGSWFFSDKIALAAYNARPVNQAEAPALYDMVEKMCDRARLPMAAVYIIPTAAANAFATGRDPHHAAVAVTEGIMRILPEDELEGVIAHELSHIKNRDTLTQAVAATVAGGISWLTQIASYSMWFGGGSRDNRSNPIVMLLTIMLAPVAASVVQMAISRTREFAADAGAGDLTGNPRALAQALQRLDQNARQMPLNGNPAFEPLLIMNGFSGKFMANLFSTHPSTEARIEKLLQLEQKLLG
ncbi:MAG: M48 family metalloprotease [Okeania sp. SIO2G4]|uniref:M48 family metalloprotease n=1 Tax=unclassified Okeania TaxID=2634635 RepID=UPI0013B5F53E|nr:MULTISPECIES: M48 family metalloprotease [unclassified Okeania]NEP07534.1 M48 family metalloprotease [Okeania sp. SIO4D6]NEP71144.1 M48 family metalloprotease [Okeania sp. SIO2G5]NEP92058.1 M48 family metalloprotease [Okeania sp. SIO2F5]NEQ94590.1 M48 family metalloprotease [Okeania sp. SIO2G4]